MKIAVIGGGSTYTPELIEGFIELAGAWGLEEVSLMDIDAARLEAVGGFIQRMVAADQGTFRVTLTTDLEQAVSGAGFVITQIRVDGQPARHEDIQLGLRYDLIGQETTGVGGFAKAMRTIPPMLDICQAIQKHARDAWLINFTNPSGLVTEAVYKHSSVRVIGLCNNPINFRMGMAAAFQAEPAEIDLDYVGLNHLSWIRKVKVRGEDMISTLLELASDIEGPANVEDLEFPPMMFKALGMIPSPYLRYYYQTEAMLETLKAKPRSRAEEVMEIENELLEIYRDPAENRKPVMLERRGGTFYSKAAVELIDSLYNDLGHYHIVNVPNDGIIDGLPQDSIIETTCVVDGNGAQPLPLGKLEPEIMGLIRVVKAYEQLTIQAAVNNDYSKAYLALVTHPLGPDADVAEQLLDEIISTHQLQLIKPA